MSAYILVRIRLDQFLSTRTTVQALCSGFDCTNYYLWQRSLNAPINLTKLIAYFTLILKYKCLTINCTFLPISLSSKWTAFLIHICFPFLLLLLHQFRINKECFLKFIGLSFLYIQVNQPLIRRSIWSKNKTEDPSVQAATLTINAKLP